MSEKSKRNTFLSRKNLLYVLWIVALVAVMVTAVIVVTRVSTGGNDNLIDNSGTGDGTSNVQPIQPDDNGGSDGGENTGGDNTGNENSGGDNIGGNENDQPGNLPVEPSEPDTPVSGKISFIMPCVNATVIKGYTSDTVVFNSTLGAYMGHLAIDFSAEEGTSVLCVYDGVVESIVTSYLTGTTITVDHGNGLKSVYNSIVANEALYEGVSVEQGDLLGTVSANNLQEYKDGPHLHFEVIKNGEKVNPEDYLIGEEK